MTTRDLGAAVVAFTLPSGILVGDTVYMASRNIEPMKIVGYHLPTQKVTSVATGSGLTSQALGADPAGRYLYVGVDHERAGHHNLYRLDLTDPTGPIEDLAEIEGLNIIALTVSPDGQVFFCGTEKSPKVYQYDPVTRKVTDFGSPDPLATMGRAIVATESTVFYGSGSVLSGGGDASRAEVFAVDRATGAVASITPPEIAAAPVVRDLQIIGDQLAVGTQGSPTPAPFAFVDLDDYSSVTVVDTSGTSAKLFREHDDRVYFVGLTGIGVHTPSTGAVEEIKVPGIGDPVRRTELWRLDPKQSSSGFAGLAVLGRHLYAMGNKGQLFVIDRHSRAIVHTADHKSIVPDLSTLLVHRGHVYGASRTTLYRIDRKTFEITALVTGLAGKWYGIPRICVDERGRFYVLRDRNLIQVAIPHQG
ncbi:hypothetical protein [Streptomyces anulatus]|uniref:hypothetical protein n=1 Tax=Streptomyces anulatus TaxID=1892 RepID=UPI003414C227